LWILEEVHGLINGKGLGADNGKVRNGSAFDLEK